MGNRRSKPPFKGFAVHAAGKTLSDKNAKRLKAAKGTAQGLADAISEILDDAGVAEDDETSASRRDEDLLNAESDFSRHVRRSTWYQKLDTTLYVFSYYFVDAVYDAANGNPPEGDDSIQGMIADLSNMLTELAASYQDAISAEVQASEENYVQFSCGKLDLVEAEAHNNRYPIEVKLFDLDKPSEGVPAVGPGLPLYVPTEVAAQAVSQVMGLPLDADESLATHANEDIVGVMVNAEIRDGGFWVRGHLYPFNKPERVAQIRAEKDKLGASINAIAPGHVETIDGRRVHVVDKLTLLGSCILYSDNATFQQTKVVAHSPTRKLAAKTAPQPDQIAAQSQPEPIGENDVDQAQFEQLTSSVNQLSTNMNTLTEAVQVLMQEREEQHKKDQQVAAEQQKKSQHEEMLTMIRQQTHAAVKELVNPSGQPQRLSSPPVQAGTESTVDPSQLELVRLEAQLTELSRHRDSKSMERRVALTDRIHTLKVAQGLA
jgi:hypothetical protein